MNETLPSPRSPKTPLWVRFVAAFFVVLILVGLVAAPFALFGKSPLLESESGQLLLDGTSIKYLTEKGEVEVASGSVLKVRGGTKLIFEEQARLSVQEKAPYAEVHLMQGNLVATRGEEDRSCLIRLGPFTLTLDTASESYLEVNPDQEIGGSVASGTLLLQCDPSYADKAPPEAFDMKLFKSGIRLEADSSFGVVGETLFVKKPKTQAQPDQPEA